MMGYGYGNDGWWMLFMGLFWVVLVAVVIWAVMRLSQRSGEPTRATLESPRHILDRRFASGEIDETQYAQARRVLDGRSVDDARGTEDSRH